MPRIYVCSQQFRGIDARSHQSSNTARLQPAPWAAPEKPECWTHALLSLPTKGQAAKLYWPVSGVRQVLWRSNRPLSISVPSGPCHLEHAWFHVCSRQARQKPVPQAVPPSPPPAKSQHYKYGPIFLPKAKLGAGTGSFLPIVWLCARGRNSGEIVLQIFLSASMWLASHLCGFLDLS